jgi:NAD-dependent SIR2 family protein deacetylase
MFYRLRSYLGYPPVRDALPNTSHYAIAALQYASYLPRLVTQNVDGLHHKAIAHLWEPDHIQKQILELHGTLHVRFGAVLHSLTAVSAKNKPIILLAASTLHARSYSP